MKLNSPGSPKSQARISPGEYPSIKSTYIRPICFVVAKNPYCEVQQTASLNESPLIDI